jgi:hypothetical protein
MSIHRRYAWYVAVIWPDADGVPTAVIYDWDYDSDRGTGKFGERVAAFHFKDRAGQTFDEVLARMYYEVDDRQRPGVSAEGVSVLVRREMVPVPVPATARATVGA